MHQLIDTAGGKHRAHLIDYTDPDALLPKEQASVITGLAPRTLDNKRCDGTGPRFIRLSSRCVRYRRRDLIEWVAERERTKTESRIPPRDQSPTVEASRRVKP